MPELGASLGISKGAVSAWEVGRSSPDLAQICRLATLLSSTPHELLGWSAADAAPGIDAARLAQALALLEQHAGRRFDALPTEKKARLLAYLYARDTAPTIAELAGLLLLMG